MVISHNLSAMNTSRQNGLVVNDVSKSAEKLSSGYKINKSADDAAGLSISEKMRRQIRGLTQASSNCEDGISYVQTADGALEEVHDMLQRSRELSVQAANGTNSDSDRQAIQKELDQLKTEIDRVAQTTKFNETNIFDAGNVGKAVENTGVNNNIVVNGITKTGATSVDIKPVTFSYTDAELDAVIASASNDGIHFDRTALDNFAHEIADNYVPQFLYGITNAFSTSATPSVANMTMGFKFVYDTGSSAVATCVSNGIGYEMTINLKYLPVSATGQPNPDEQIKGSIAHELMHGVMFDITTNGMLNTNGADQFPMWFIEGMAESVNGIHAGSLASINPDTASNATITNWLNKLTDESDPYNYYQQGSVACLYLGYVAGGDVLDSAHIANGLDKILKDISDGFSLSEAISRNTNYSGIDDFTNRMKTDAVQFVKDYYNIRRGHTSSSLIAPGGLGADYNDAGGMFSLIGGSNTDDFFTLDVSKDYASSLSDNNGKFVAAGTDPYTGGGATTTPGTRRDGSINPDAHTHWTGGNGNGNVAGGGIDKQFYTPRTNGDFTNIMAGTDSDLTNKVFIKQFCMSTYDLAGISVASVMTDNLADDAMTRYGKAIELVSSVRSYFGAIQNRLEHTINNLDNVVENTTAAESQIRDTDMATEMVKFSNGNVLSQAGQSMLAQANQKNQGVLQLIA